MVTVLTAIKRFIRFKTRISHISAAVSQESKFQFKKTGQTFISAVIRWNWSDRSSGSDAEI